ncbi:MAG: TetR/AcrR family transcriptional regulator [Proteobacteria bacterium]|nr:TetR/AcrR family transcriptional regulator [Pseudomonadota bacterium]
MVSPKTDSHDARSRIIDAALDLFSEKGFHATTTRKIAEKAGVNEVTLFRQFNNKLTLFQETLNEIKKIGFDMDIRAKEFEIEPEEAIQIIVESVFEIFENNPREIRLLNLALLEGVEGFEEDFVAKSTSKALELIANIIKKLQDQHKITSRENPEMLAQMLLYQTVEMATQWVLGKYTPLKKYDRPTICNAIVRLFMS